MFLTPFGFIFFFFFSLSLSLSSTPAPILQDSLCLQAVSPLTVLTLLHILPAQSYTPLGSSLIQVLFVVHSLSWPATPEQTFKFFILCPAITWRF
ncbi:hypothetical protein GGS20DRAFT_144934 [Poronia punctata]|nr:hypothetical protein GGS20DRAFT_144934 [Poronia punctata]